MSSTARSPAATSTPARRYADRGSATLPGTDPLLEDELAARRVVRHGLRVVAVEAGEAEPLIRQLERREHAPDREVAERLGADELADLGLGVGRRDQLGLDRGVDPVEARVVDRGRTDAHVDLGGAGLAQQLDDALG